MAAPASVVPPAPSAEPQAPGSSKETAPANESAVPEWIESLREAEELSRNEAPSSDQPPAESTETEPLDLLSDEEMLPEWLARLRANPPEVEEEQDLDAKPETSQPPDQTPSPETAPSDAGTDWIAQLRTQAQSAEPPVEPAPESETFDLQAPEVEASEAQSAETQVEPSAELPQAESLDFLGVEPPATTIETSPWVPEAEPEEPSAPTPIESPLDVTEPPTTAPITSESVQPDWLDQLSAEVKTEDRVKEEEGSLFPPFEVEPGPTLEEAQPVPVPPWLEELPQEAQPPASQEPVPSEAAWEFPEAAELTQEQAPQPSEGEIKSSQAPSEEIPEWLQESLAQQAETAPQEPEATPSVPPFEETLFVVAEGEQVQPAVEAEETPDWLQLGAPAVEMAEQPAESSATLVEPVPPIAEEAKLEEVAPEPEVTAVPAELAAEPVAEVKEPEAKEPEGIEPEAKEPEEKEAEAAEALPAWITALRPQEAAVPESAATAEPIELSGPLAGLRGVIGVALAVAEPHPPAKRAEPPERKDAARLFESILAEPVAETEGRTFAKIRRADAMRSVVYALMALAVLIPFVLPAVLAGTTIPISQTPAAEFYDVIQGIPSGQVVLVAFDYDPSVAREMNLLARAVVRDLIGRRVKIVALSTLETGPQFAQNELRAAASEVSNYQYGVDYINLGYLPGHEAGLAQLGSTGIASSTKDYDLGKDYAQFSLTSNLAMQDVALVVELAGTEQPLRMWLEQFRPQTKTPIVAGVSAAVEPQARAYRGARQLAATLSGLVGAAQYEILSNRIGLAVTNANAQSLAQLALVLIIVLGNIVFWISRVRNKEHD